MNKGNYDKLMKSLTGDKPTEDDMWEIENVFRRISEIDFEKCRAVFTEHDYSGNRLGIDIVSKYGIILCLHTDIGPNDYSDWYIGDTSYTIWNGRTMLVSDCGWLDTTLEFWNDFGKKTDEFYNLRREYMKTGKLGEYIKIRDKKESDKNSQ